MGETISGFPHTRKPGIKKTPDRGLPKKAQRTGSSHYSLPAKFMQKSRSAHPLAGISFIFLPGASWASAAALEPAGCPPSIQPVPPGSGAAGWPPPSRGWCSPGPLGALHSAVLAAPSLPRGPLSCPTSLLLGARRDQPAAPSSVHSVPPRNAPAVAARRSPSQPARSPPRDRVGPRRLWRAQVGTARRKGSMTPPRWGSQPAGAAAVHAVQVSRDYWNGPMKRASAFYVNRGDTVAG